MIFSNTNEPVAHDVDTSIGVTGVGRLGSERLRLSGNSLAIKPLIGKV
jgi:hypothetical protein